ncbi:MAG: HNH endonuclease [Methanophagales archaeon]|nr:HNH endonuclease [Methanophagales archaeon]
MGRKKKLEEYSEKLFKGLRKQYRADGKYKGADERERVNPNSDRHKEVCNNANWKCEICGSEYIKASAIFQIHHIDGNRENGDTNNLALLCANDHSEIHGKARAKMDNYKKTHPPQRKPREGIKIGEGIEITSGGDIVIGKRNPKKR